MKYLESMIVWTPNDDAYASNPTRGKIDVVPWPDTTGRSKPYRMSVGACFMDLKKQTPAERTETLFRDFHLAVVVGKIDPQMASDAFMQINEFRTIIDPSSDS